jgi:tRNA threonylcarbamoyladenosine biosynthesis protein TsaE
VKLEEHVFDTPEALEEFGWALAATLNPGSVVLLVGPMGAGKTTLTKGIARGLGFTGEVTSPTYTYIHEYPTPQGVLVHSDAYRLEDARKLFGLGLEELIENARLTVIEWGEGLLDDLENPVLIRLEPIADGRKLTLERDT